MACDGLPGDESLKLGIGFQQLFHQRIVFLGIQTLDYQQPLVGHLDNQGLARFGALIQRVFEIRFEAAQWDGLDGHGIPQAAIQQPVGNRLH
jgi:hypothetical protein